MKTAYRAPNEYSHILFLCSCFLCSMNKLGNIEYKEFVNAVRRKPRGAEEETRKRRNEDEEGKKVDRTVVNDLIRLPSKKKQMDAFRDYDKKDQGHISYQGFRFVLRDLGIGLSEREWEQLLSAFDKDDKRYIVYEEFVSWVEKMKSKEGQEGSKEEGKEDSPERGERRKISGGSGSYAGRRKGNLEADEAVELSVLELRLSDKALVKGLKGFDVKVHYDFLEEEKHVSKGTELKGAEVDIDFVKTFPLKSGSELREGLMERMQKKPAQRNIKFVLTATEGNRR